MTAKTTADFRAAVRRQPSEWLTLCLRDWRRTGGANLGGATIRARIIAVVRAELRRRHVAQFRDIATITEYGLTCRLSNAVRCF